MVLLQGINIILSTSTHLRQFRKHIELKKIYSRELSTLPYAKKENIYSLIKQCYWTEYHNVIEYLRAQGSRVQTCLRLMDYFRT